MRRYSRGYFLVIPFVVPLALLAACSSDTPATAESATEVASSAPEVEESEPVESETESEPTDSEPTESEPAEESAPAETEEAVALDPATCILGSWKQNVAGDLQSIQMTDPEGTLEYTGQQLLTFDAGALTIADDFSRHSIFDSDGTPIDSLIVSKGTTVLAYSLDADLLTYGAVTSSEGSTTVTMAGVAGEPQSFADRAGQLPGKAFTVTCEAETLSLSCSRAPCPPS